MKNSDFKNIIRKILLENFQYTNRDKDPQIYDMLVDPIPEMWDLYGNGEDFLKPEAPIGASSTSAPLGVYAFGQYRNKNISGAVPPEVDSDYEKELFKAIMNHMDNKTAPLKGEHLAIIKAMVASGNYKNIFMNPPEGTAIFRGESASDNTMKKWLGLGEEEQVPQNPRTWMTQDVNFVWRNHRGKRGTKYAGSWTTDEEVANDFSIGDRKYQVILTAAPGQESNFIAFSDIGSRSRRGIYPIFDTEFSYSGEQEVMSLGPVKVSQIKWITSTNKWVTSAKLKIKIMRNSITKRILKKYILETLLEQERVSAESDPETYNDLSKTIDMSQYKSPGYRGEFTKFKKPEAPEGAVFDRYFLGKKRNQTHGEKHIPPEEDNDIEKKIMDAIETHVRVIQKPIDSNQANIIKDIIKNGFYKDIFIPAKDGEVILRGQVASTKKFKKWLGLGEDDEIPESGEKDVNFTWRNFRGSSGGGSWTTDEGQAKKFAKWNSNFEVSKDRPISVVMVADSSEKNNFLNLEKLYAYFGQLYDFEKEMISLGPVKVSRIMWKNHFFKKKESENWLAPDTKYKYARDEETGPKPPPFPGYDKMKQLYGESHKKGRLQCTEITYVY